MNRKTDEKLDRQTDIAGPKGWKIKIQIRTEAGQKDWNNKTEKQKDRKKQDRSETCFKTVINNWFASPILLDRNMKRRGYGESKKVKLHWKSKGNPKED